MEYKKSEPIHGKLNGHYTTFYQYEFPRATRNKGRFLPQGTVRLREFLCCDGDHGQLVQLVVIAPDELAGGNEKRALVDKMLNMNREDKKFREGTLTSQDLSGEVREYTGKKMICLNQILAEQERIGLFASARRIKDSNRRRRRIRRWKIRFQVALALVLFIVGLASGGFLQKGGFFDLDENDFYQNYVVVFVDKVEGAIQQFSH